MGSPYLLISIFAVYLWLVLKAGPKFMSNRMAFELTKITRAYNVFQLLGSAFCVIYAQQLGLTWRLGWKCIDAPKGLPEDHTDELIYLGKCSWFYLLFRMSEFLETVFFVLRKKQNQVSLLHVYHHIAVVALFWLFFKYNSGRNEVFIVLVNSSVHTIMYAYYLFSSFASFREATMKVKHLITALQIAQLIFLVGHCIRIISSCNPTKLYYLQAANISILVIMFLKFYGKSYSNKRKSV